MLELQSVANRKKLTYSVVIELQSVANRKKLTGSATYYYEYYCRTGLATTVLYRYSTVLVQFSYSRLDYYLVFVQ